jgi:segregation and condensation protein B
MSLSLRDIVEGLLFVSGDPLDVDRVTAVVEGVAPERVQKVLDELEAQYEDMGRAFVLRRVAGGYQFRTKPELSPYILRLKKKSPTRLSQAALETLAVIAYRQPILRAEIEKIRGVDVGGIVKTLMEKGLVRGVGRKDLPGRPIIYGTTRKFLETFDLPSLEALPSIEEMESLGPDDEGRLF